MFRLLPGQFPVGRVCSATSQVYFQSAEFVPPCHGSNSGRQSTSRDDYRTAGGVPPRPGSISSWQRVFRYVPGRFLVGRICSATSQANFRSAEFVPPRSGWISGRQSVFLHILGRFQVNRVCSTTFWVDFRRHVPARFSFGKVCSAASLVDFRSVECVPPHTGSISGRQSVFRHVLGGFLVGRVCQSQNDFFYHNWKYLRHNFLY